MTYKLIAFDLDGTLLNSKGEILSENKAAIEAIQAKGYKVVVVTGRHHTAVKPYYYELGLDTPIICCNGTYIYQPQTDEVLVGNPLSTVQAEKILDLAKTFGVNLLMYSRDAMNFEVLTPHMDKFQQWVATCPEHVRPDVRQVESLRAIVDSGDTIWKFVISHPDRQLMVDTVAQLSEDEFSTEWSWVDRVDVSNHGNTKGNRLLELAKQWGIEAEEIIAFGDNHNDASMLKAVGLGVAMGNAEAEVQAQANKVITTNNEPGIADLLNNL